LRQIALVAQSLAPVEAELRRVLGIDVCYRDPGVGHFGLENALFPIGNELLEVVSPVQEGTAGGRYLERRGGDGGYMVITQCNDHAARRARVEALGIRLVAQLNSGAFRNMQLHPKDTGGSFFEIDEMHGPRADEPDGPWEPAGPDWQRARRLERVTGIRAAEVQCEKPLQVAKRWSEIAEIPLVEQAGNPTLPLANARVRFVPCLDGRPEGLAGIDLACADKAAILAAAAAAGNAVVGEDQVLLCGMRIRLT